MRIPNDCSLLHVFTSRGRVIGFSTSRAGKLQCYLNEEVVRGRITCCSPTGDSLLVGCSLECSEQTDNLFFLHLRDAYT